MPRRAPRPRSAVSSFFAGAAALAAAAVPIVVLAVLVPAQASAQSAAAYVALGDSYSSGVGAGSYIGSSGSCDRSTNSYPALWDAANQPASYVSEACSGRDHRDRAQFPAVRAQPGDHAGVDHGRRQ